MKKPNRLKIFYYSHPYLMILGVLIIWNLIIIAIAALLMSYIQTDGMINWETYLGALEYGAIYTMNSGGIYDDAKQGVIIIKIILAVVQMISFTGALIGLATSMLQNMFDKRINNVGKVKIKHHFVILNWSPIGANIIRDLSYLEGRKTVVVLSNQDRKQIIEQIDTLFLETGTKKKKLSVFVKQANPSSRKALREINIDKAEAIVLLCASTWNNTSNKGDVDSFKLLMSVVSTAKKGNIIIETDNPEATKNINSLTEASDLKNFNISIFSRNVIVGRALGRSSINASFADVYYYLLSLNKGNLYSVKKDFTVKEAFQKYNNALPVVRYNNDFGVERLFLYADKRRDLYSGVKHKPVSKAIPFVQNYIKNDFTLFVIGDNIRLHAIKEEINIFNKIGTKGKISLKPYPFDVELDKFVSEINKVEGKKKILVLSDERADDETLDSNVIDTIIKLKTNKEMNQSLEIFAEVFDPSNRYSLQTLNIAGVIVANEMVALYISNLMAHPIETSLYEDILMASEGSEGKLDFDIRQAKEILSFKGEITFNSKAELVESIYEASKEKLMLLGMVGLKERKSIIQGITGAVSSVVNVVGDVVSTVGNALTLSDSAVDSPIDQSDVVIFNKNIHKKQKITLKEDSVLILVNLP
ncbi:MAG: NAD-binding protein [Bacilli bacterium]|nr:NAD-binding protein [Bacilli bacterium]